MTASTSAAFQPNQIVPISAPSENEIGQIMRLKHVCENGLDIGILLTTEFLRSIERHGGGAFKMVRDEEIIGFVFFYSFIPEEAEAMIFVHSDEDWSKITSILINAAKRECERRGHSRLLFMNDKRFSAGAELLVKEGCNLAFSEHRMALTNDGVASCHHVSLSEVGDEDATLRKIEHACFRRFLSKPDQRRFIASCEGRPVGKIDVCMDGTKAELTGFCVIPEYRRRGYGRSILMEIVYILRIEGMMGIELDVQTDNEKALSLYQKSGFRRESTMDFYELVLKRED